MSANSEAWTVVRGVGFDTYGTFVGEDGDVDIHTIDVTSGPTTVWPLALMGADGHEGVEVEGIGVAVVAVVFDEEMAKAIVKDVVQQRERYIADVNEAIGRERRHGWLRIRDLNRVERQRLRAAVDAVPKPTLDPTLTPEACDQARYFILGPGPVRSPT